MRSIALVLLFAGCGPVDVAPCEHCDGIKMSDYFPADGARTWTYASWGLPYRLDATLAPGAQSSLYTVMFGRTCADTGQTGCAEGPYRIASWSWSSDDATGTLLHGYTAADGTVTTFDPPITVFGEFSAYGASPLATVERDGTTWTSTIVELPGACPQTWTNSWGDVCLHFTLDDGGKGSPLAGDYWAVNRWGIIAFRLYDEAVKWELQGASFDTGTP